MAICGDSVLRVGRGALFTRQLGGGKYDWGKRAEELKECGDGVEGCGWSEDGEKGRGGGGDGEWGGGREAGGGGDGGWRDVTEGGPT